MWPETTNLQPASTGAQSQGVPLKQGDRAGRRVVFQKRQLALLSTGIEIQQKTRRQRRKRETRVKGDERQEPGPPATPSAHAVPSWPGSVPGHPPQTHRPLHSRPGKPGPPGLQQASVCRTALDSAGPPRPQGAHPHGPPALPLDVPEPPTTTARPRLGALRCLSRSVARPQPTVLLRPRQCWHGGWGSLGVDEGHPRLVFTVRV